MTGGVLRCRMILVKRKRYLSISLRFFIVYNNGGECMKKIILSGIFIILSLCLTFVCGCNKYNAVLYSHAEKWISEDFLEKNRVKAYYPNKDYIEGESDPWEEILYDKESPDSRTFVITNQYEFAKIFTKYDSTVDFNRQIVILYIFGDVYPARDYFFNKLTLKEQSLKIYYRLENRKGDDATMPYQRCLMVKLDKLDIVAVNFEEI